MTPRSIHIVKRRYKGKLTEYHYAWRGGPRIKGKPGTAEYAQSYADAYDRKPKHSDTSLVASMIRQYKTSPDFGCKSDKWKREKLRFLDLILGEFGEDDIAIFDDARVRKDIIEFRDSMRETPRKADHVIGELSTFLSWCRDRGFVSKNIAQGIKKIGVVDRSNIIWTQNELEAVCNVATPDASNAIRFGALTGVPRSDLVALQWHQVETHSFQYMRKKTGEIGTVPIYDELRELLSRIPKRSVFVLTNSYGKPWTADGLSTAFRRAKLKAGIDKRFHDLRGTAVTFLYASGFSDDDVADIVGWSLKSVRDIKRRYVSREAVAKARILRLDKSVQTER